MDERQYIQEDEITLKELILKIQEYTREVIRNWWVVVLITIPFVAYFLYEAYTTPVTYPATLTYMVNEDEGGGLGGVTSVLSQFGLVGGGNSEYNLDKIVQLSKSNRIIRDVLLTKGEVDGKQDYFANHIIHIHELHKKWRKDTTGLKEFWFDRDSVQNFSRLENKALYKLIGVIKGNSKQKIEGIYSSKYDETSGILSVNVNSQSEDLSIKLANEFYSRLSSFYIDKTIEKQKATYSIVESKVDSLQKALNSKQYSYLNFDDTHRNMTLKRYNARKLELERDLQVLALAYGEAVKNLEIADFSLKSSTPFFQVLDEPLEPISLNQKSKFKAIIIGGILGVIISSMIILLFKTYREIMTNET